MSQKITSETLLTLIKPVIPPGHRITSWLRLASTCGGYPVPSLLRARSAIAGCAGACSGELECVQGQRLHNFSGQPVLVFDHPHSKKVSSLT